MLCQSKFDPPESLQLDSEISAQSAKSDICPIIYLHMPPIVRSATVNTDKDDHFVRRVAPSQIFQYLVNHGLGLLLEDEVLSEVANNVLEQEEVVGVEPCI